MVYDDGFSSEIPSFARDPYCYVARTIIYRQSSRS